MCTNHVLTPYSHVLSVGACMPKHTALSAAVSGVYSTLLLFFFFARWVWWGWGQVLSTCSRKAVVKWLPLLGRVLMVAGLWVVFVPVCTSWL